MKTGEQGEKNEKRFVAVIDVCIVIAIIVIFAVGTGLFGKRQLDDNSGRAREFSGQAGAASATTEGLRERLGELGDILGSGLTDVAGGLGELATEFEGDVGELRQLVQRLRSGAEKVRVLENRVYYLDKCLSGFMGWYYDALDAEIERELGINAP
jgi:hypothetical protein